MKNRFYGRIKISKDGETIDVADVKTKSKKGKDFFLKQVCDALSALGKQAAESFGPDKKFDIEYQGDFGDDLNVILVKTGASDFGTRKGTLGAI